MAEAPAKVNLHLAVFDRRPDGFHNIVSLFQAVSLYDILEIQRSSTRGVAVFGDFDCPPEANTIVRAARGFLGAAGLSEGVEIHARKRIPAGAGLGGGSSDAAMVLYALNRMFDEPLRSAELESLGGAIGSDVPFFLKGACAVVSGSGDRIQPVEARTDFSLVLLYPGFPTQTARAYGAIDASRERVDAPGGLKPYGETEPRAAQWIRAEYRKSPAAWSFRNDFFEVLAQEEPEFQEAFRILRDSGADFVSLTGSGSAFIGVFQSSEAARGVVGELNGREGRYGNWFSVLAMPLARMPNPRLE